MPDVQVIEAGSPAIEFDARAHDFGTVTEGDTLKHVFTVTNTGTLPLLLREVRSSCDCLTTTFESKEIPPGSTAPIEVTLSTQGRAGVVRKTVTVTSNDENRASTVLEIKASVERLLDFERRSVRLNTDHGTDKIQKIWLTGKLAGDAQLKLAKVEGDANQGDKALTVRVVQEQEADQIRRGLELKLRANRMASGEGSVTVSTGVPDRAELNLRFNYSINGNLTVTPEKLVIGPGSKSANREHAIRITSKKSDFRVLRVRVAEGPYEAVFEKLDRGEGYRVLVYVKESSVKNWGSSAERKNGKLEIYTNDSVEPKRTVEIQAQSAAAPARGSGGATTPNGAGTKVRPEE